MRYMLDTNIVSDLLRNPRGLAARRAAALADVVCVSIIVAAELRYGVAKRRSVELTRKVEALLLEIPVVPLEGPVDRAYAAIRTELELAGLPIGSNDMLIAAHAYALGATAVTANVKEFGRVTGLRVENWLE